VEVTGVGFRRAVATYPSKVSTDHPMSKSMSSYLLVAFASHTRND
jgi:hypothetical protein